MTFGRRRRGYTSTGWGPSWGSAVAKSVHFMGRPRWWDRAACTGVGPDVFFDPSPDAEQLAKAICAGCEVAEACAAWAGEQRIGEGVFGGLTALERRSGAALVTSSA